MTPEEYLLNPQKSIVVYPNDILTSVAQPITNLEPWKQISEIMSDIMIVNDGVGLAAPQIGIPYCAFTIKFPDKNILYINPEIISSGDRKEEKIEGCLSLPNVNLKIIRPRKIKVKWINLDGKEKIATYEGLTARVFQHEFDHLKGKLITMHSA